MTRHHYTPKRLDLPAPQRERLREVQRVGGSFRDALRAIGARTSQTMLAARLAWVEWWPALRSCDYGPPPEEVTRRSEELRHLHQEGMAYLHERNRR